MQSLVIHAIHLHLPEDIRAAIETELVAGGLHGNFYIGSVVGIPSALYLLAHEQGQVPFSRMIRRDAIDSVESARAAAFEFVLKWKQGAC